MPDPVVDRWKQKHPIYLWRYTEKTRNYPGWHLTASDDSCRAVADLLDLMLAARFSSRKELRITPPTPPILGVPNNSNAEWKTAETLLLKYPKDEVEPSHWQIDAENRSIVLTLGEGRVKELQKALAELPAGVDDYSIGPSSNKRESECLWFWHFP